MNFQYPSILLLILFAITLFFFVKKYNFDQKLFSKRVLKRIAPSGFTKQSYIREYFLILSLIFAIIALARPYIKGKEIKVNSKSYDIVVGFDISNSMLSDDIYPNRLSFAKIKFYQFLKNLKEERVAVLGFTSKAFLVAPPTTDYDTLKFLVKNMQTDYISLKGTNILNFLVMANDIFPKGNTQKAVLIFTDGGDKKDYKKEIEYAKAHNIRVYIYAIATQKGGVIKTSNGVLKDKNGNIVVVKLNKAIEELALQTGGAYQHYSLKNNDIKELVKVIRERFEKDLKKSIKVIKNNKELFYYPLLVAIILFFLANFSISNLLSFRRVS